MEPTPHKPRVPHGACKRAVLAANLTTTTIAELAKATGLPENSLRTAAYLAGIHLKYERKPKNINYSNE